MIVRIMAEGQWEVPNEQMSALNELDANLESAVEGSDEEAFRQAMSDLLAAVRDRGRQLPDDELVDSDLVLPPADASAAEVRELLGDEGLIPG